MRLIWDGEQVVVSGAITATPLVTVLLRTKWYYLLVVQRPVDRRLQIRRVTFDELQPAADALRISAYHNHLPNPTAVRHWAESCGYDIDELAEELIVGRWTIEHEL